MPNATKYATVAVHEETGSISVFRGKKNVDFTIVGINEDDWTSHDFTRRALLHLPEPMTPAEFEAFTDDRDLHSVIKDCIRPPEDAEDDEG